MSGTQVKRSALSFFTSKEPVLARSLPNIRHRTPTAAHMPSATSCAATLKPIINAASTGSQSSIISPRAMPNIIRLTSLSLGNMNLAARNPDAAYTSMYKSESAFKTKTIVPPYYKSKSHKNRKP